MDSVPELIRKKRDGGQLSQNDIERLVSGYTRGDIPDYQMSALLMAVLWRGMTPEETAWLTGAMVDSGRRLDLSAIPGVKVDKHSTGGVGDKTTLVVAPLVAAAGVPVAKLSGRGLGHTGGTLDKLQAIPGLRVDLSAEEFVSQVRDIGLAVTGQAADLVPADGKIYGLRDVTATVDSIPLIAASIMSKKIAGGADAIVLDVKMGRGAFMPDLASARSLATAMVELGGHFGRRVAAVISGMDQPLGQAVGNALEVAEAAAVLTGAGPDDLRELCLELGVVMLDLAGLAGDRRQARDKLDRLLAMGAGLKKLAEMVSAQGGDAQALFEPDRLPRAPVTLEVQAGSSGYVHHLDALAVGQAAMALGAGRQVKGQAVDPAVGVILTRKVGEEVRAGEAVAFIHARDENSAADAAKRLQLGLNISDIPCPKPPLIIETIN